MDNFLLIALVVGAFVLILRLLGERGTLKEIAASIGWAIACGLLWPIAFAIFFLSIVWALKEDPSC